MTSMLQQFIRAKRLLRLRGQAVLIGCFLLPFVLLFSQSAVAETAKHYTDLVFQPLPEVPVPPYTRFEMKNGMVVYLMEDHELPLVSGTALIRTGERLEPGAQVGLAEIMGTVMRSGGTQKHSADALNQLLEQRAASVETAIDSAFGSASFDTLTENLPQVFSLFSEVVRQPLFPQDKIDLAKTQLRGSIARRNDDPDDIASREFQKLIYGNTSPYARTVEYATLNNVSRESVLQFYQQYFYPNNFILGVVGDFDSKAMRSLIEKAFGDWQPNSNFKKPALPSVSQSKKGGVFFVDQPQLTQSYIQVGHLGGQLSSPDYGALSVMNEVLNGFAGRLFNQIRSRQGLAYSVYAFWSPRFDYPGVFVAGGETRSDATVAFVRSLLAEIERIRTSPVSQQELTVAKDSVANSFVFNFQSRGQILSRLLRYEYYGYPKDFLQRYRQAIAKTTIEDVQRVANTYLKPENLVVLVVGNGSAINPPLANLSPETKVTQIDITIPQPQAGN
ncbi:MAG: pitrilysin family protein [Leptolyngbyaceae cyanobacterium bins.59]|nr:pitrilysin family protein [Leptolyngbyaceae cyanobacterium bins.59]